jgi:hypothetical protein
VARRFCTVAVVLFFSVSFGAGLGAAATDVVFELSFRRREGIANSHMGVVVICPLGVGARGVDLIARDVQIDADIEVTTLLVVAVGFGDHDAATRDSTEDVLEPFHPLPDVLLERGARGHLVKRDCRFDSHDQRLCDRHARGRVASLKGTRATGAKRSRSPPMGRHFFR